MNNQWSKIAMGAALVVTLVGCQDTSLSISSWKTYQNPRYGFEFPYPSDWIAQPTPSNLSGQAFVATDQSRLQLRGWAQENLAPARLLSSKRQDFGSQQNFTTKQGLTGKLKVEVGDQLSSIELVITDGTIEYYLQGQASGDQFADYYRFFHYVASNYRIPEATGNQE